jgi:hypothetical protein
VSTLGQAVSDPAVQAMIQGIVQQAQRTGLATPAGRANAAQQTLQWLGGAPPKAMRFDAFGREKPLVDQDQWRRSQEGGPLSAAAGPAGRYPLKHSQGLDFTKLPNGLLGGKEKLDGILGTMSPQSREAAIRYLNEEILTKFRAEAPVGSSFKVLTTTGENARVVGRATEDKAAAEALGKVTEWLGPNTEGRFGWGLRKPGAPDQVPWALTPEGKTVPRDPWEYMRQHREWREGQPPTR